MDGPPLASLSLTHVYYNPADPFSHLSAWLALVPQGLCVIYATLIWSSREVEVMLMFAGQMACEAVNWVLKRYIKEERPSQMHGKGYGMPSSHAQFVAFFSVSVAFFLLFRHSPHPTLTHTPTTYGERVILSIVAVIGASLVAYSRIYLNYHKPSQVLVGCGVGAAFAVVWFIFTALLRSQGWISWGLEHPVAKWFRVRDLVIEEDLVDSGWSRWLERKPKRNTTPAKKSR